ncbi:SEC-C metal-binding domain-containing protein [Actinomadura sp. NPDC048021]|uniref:SEC-C metal-binding domain-containing protein n=1 Tax=Actinomadura sp. NPDC048021 TaxID=3155385 RepID=UPI0033C53D7A
MDSAGENRCTPLTDDEERAEALLSGTGEEDAPDLRADESAVEDADVVDSASPVVDGEDWCRRHEGSASGLLLGRVLTERCHLLRHCGRSEDAAACGGEAVAVLGRTEAPRLVIARAYAALAVARAENGELDDACAAAFRAIEDAENADPAEDVDVLNVAGLLGDLMKPLLTAKRTPDAEWVARRTVEMLRSVAVRNLASREDLARALFRHGVCLKGLGQLEWLPPVQEAIQLLRDQQADGLGTSQTRENLNLYMRFRAQFLPRNVAALQSGTGVERIDRHGRNDPCPCDSGRKYKRCCRQPGANRP